MARRINSQRQRLLGLQARLTLQTQQQKNPQRANRSHLSRLLDVVTTDVLISGARVAEPEGRTLASEFTAFYGEHHPRLVRYCYRLVRDEQAAFDLAQEAFARLFTRWVKVREPAAYLFRVATNQARSDHARRLREETTFATADPVDVTSARDVEVRIAVEQLPRRYRDLVLLYYFADLPLAEVARVLRRPPGTVMRQLAEARARLAIDLKDTDDAR